VAKLLVLGTDTDAGKTTFSLLWLAGAQGRCHYWKPVETGPSDSETVRRLVPGAVAWPPLVQLAEPVAPPLAARLHQTSIPDSTTIAAACPDTPELLVETFGGPFSPLNERELQVALIRALDVPLVLVSSSSLGAIGRTLQCLYALEGHGLRPHAVVLLGPTDEYAQEQIRRYRPALPVYALTAPQEWTADGVRQCAAEQAPSLGRLRDALAPCAPPESAGKVVDDLVARDRSSLWHPYTSLRDPDAPLVCVGARDEFLHLADGRRLIDGISSWWTILHGHGFPPLMDALRAAASAWDHVHFAGVTHPAAIELAELLLSSMPWRGGRVFYSDNGSTAVEVALKMAYQFWCHQGQPRRTRFVGFEHGYHGDTFGAMAVSRDPVFFGRFEPLLFRADVLPFAADRLDDHLRKNRAEVAAVIVEPLVQGAGGMRMHSPEELRTLFEAAKSNDVLFIADEVMTGGGRLGRLWAHQAADIAPDLVCAAKTLTGGVLPLAATLAAPHIAAAWDTADRGRTFFHGHSFTAHPLACAVAAANWQLLTTAFPEAPLAMERFWTQALEPLRDHAKIKEIRIRGSIAAVETRGQDGYLAEAVARMRRTCLSQGVLLRPLGNVLYALPPLGISQKSLEQVAAAMIRAATE
jgi:adenosylmethionine-8-amino-7-oxononanoate aminotransferase